MHLPRSIRLTLQDAHDPHTRIRVNDVSLKVFGVTVDPGFTGPVRVEMTLGSQFVLRDESGGFYEFRLAQGEAPIRFGFSINGLTKTDAVTYMTGTVSPDVRSTVDDVYKTIMAQRWPTRRSTARCSRRCSRHSMSRS